MIHLIDAGLSLSTFTLIFSYVFSLNLFQKSTRIPISAILLTNYLLTCLNEKAIARPRNRYLGMLGERSFKIRSWGRSQFGNVGVRRRSPS